MTTNKLFSANTKTFGAPLETILEAVKAAGFGGIEIWNDDVEDDLPYWKTRLGESGLQVSTFQLLRDFEGTSKAAMPERLEKAEALMAMMTMINAELLLVCANTDATSSKNTADMIADLRILARMASARGLRIGFEPLSWSAWINDYDKASALVDAVAEESLGLVLDTFHLFSGGGSLDVLDRINVDKLCFVQLNNVHAISPPFIEIARHHRTFPTEGIWPVADVVRHLERRGYDGYFSLEVFNDAYREVDPFDLAVQAWESLQTLFNPS